MDTPTEYKGVNTTALCCDDFYMKICPRDYCTRELIDRFSEQIITQLWRLEATLLINVILAGVIVGIGAYGHRYRHYGFTRYLLLFATTLFLPIISYVLSAMSSTASFFQVSIQGLVATCVSHFLHSYLVIVSTGLVLISAINTSSVVATDDRENRSIQPPFELLIQGIWIVYLAKTVNLTPYVIDQVEHIRYFVFTPFMLIHAKLALKCYAFLKGRKSFALGRNPRLIVGYMQQRQEGSDHHRESLTAGEEDVNVPPPLVVMGEEKQQVEKQSNGYIFKNNLEAVQGAGLVTIDRVWQLDNRLLTTMPQLKDLCLSFAFFKLLRCRFARYKLTDDVITVKKTIKFVRGVLLMDGQHERVFSMIADELSFLHDYYDSQLPVFYSRNQLTIFSIVISVLCIVYCILCGVDLIRMAYFLTGPPDMFSPSTIQCTYVCYYGRMLSDLVWIEFGSIHFELVPVLLLLVLVVVAEARDIASHICSSWTKVILICRCVHRASLELSPVIPKWARYLLQCRCNRLMRHWNERMGQNSMLVLHPRQLHQLVFTAGWLHGLLGWKRNTVKVPSAVKACIINAIRSISSGAELSKGIASLRRSQIGESLLWACNISGKGTTDIILVWHIATTILEVKHPHHQHDDPPRHTRQGGGGGGQHSSISDDKKTAATHLSRYCAYLVAFYPELLPDDDAWSKGLYRDVSKGAERALSTAGGRHTTVSSMQPEVGYRRLIELLGARHNHEVLKDAAKLAEQLGEMTATGGEDTAAWELLAGFWSEMVLYVAPSDNLNGHMHAIDRGGELVTLLWALLTHVGIVDRLEISTAASASSSSY